MHKSIKLSRQEWWWEGAILTMKVILWNLKHTTDMDTIVRDWDACSQENIQDPTALRDVFNYVVTEKLSNYL